MVPLSVLLFLLTPVGLKKDSLCKAIVDHSRRCRTNGPAIRAMTLQPRTSLVPTSSVRILNPLLDSYEHLAAEGLSLAEEVGE